MSKFLTNLAARARGTLPRLEPRRPAPFETLSDWSEPFDADMPVPAASVESPVSAPHTEESAPSALPSASVTPQAMPAAAPRGNATPATPTPVTQASPAPATPSRRMMALPPAAGVPGPAALSPVPPVAPPAPAPAVAMASVPAAPHAATAQAAPTPAVLPSLVTAAPVSPNTVSLPAAPSDPAPVISPTTSWEVLANFPDGFTYPGTEPVVSQRVPDQSPATPPPLAPVPKAPAPLLPREAAALRPKTQTPNGAKASHRPQSQQLPDVEIHIGTIEVVAEPPQARQPAHAPAPSRGVSLDDFLDGIGER